MVYIRVTGRPETIAETIEMISRVMRVVRVDKPVPFGSQGVVGQGVTADLDEVTCLHPVAELTCRGKEQRIGDAEYLVEYAVCISCSEKVVRVRVESRGALRSVGAWSGLIEVSTSKSLQSFSA